MIDPNIQSVSQGDPREQNPLLSVCIITYNHEAFIAQAIESVLSQQTEFPFEIIIGEDDSSDDTRNIIISYRDRYPDKIRVILNNRSDVIYVNGRATGQWNLIQTLSNASGKYIALVEGDDYWTDPLKLQNQVSLLEAHPEYTVCGHLVEVVGTKSEYFNEKLLGQTCPEMFSIVDALNGPTVHTSSLVFRSFDVKKHIAYPYLLILPAADVLILTMLLDLGIGYRFDSAWSAYRLHSGGTWFTKPIYLKYFESFQIGYVFYKLYPKLFHINPWKNLSATLAMAFISAIASAIRSLKIAPVTNLLAIVIKQSVVPNREFLFFTILGVLLIPLRGSIMFYRKTQSIISHVFFNSPQPKK
jgi:glycosyltransferase involved in cell wall biosynthesis